MAFPVAPNVNDKHTEGSTTYVWNGFAWDIVPGDLFKADGVYVDLRAQATTKDDVGLDLVDNTSDLDKPISTATQNALDLKESISNKGVADGYASLDSAGKVPASELPSYVDDVVEAATKADLPATGEAGKIYVVISDETSGNNTSSYRWTGAVYALVTNTLTAADVKALYETNADTNAYTDAERSKLAGIEAGATADQTASEIESLYEGQVNTNKYSDSEKASVDIVTGLNTTAQTLPKGINEVHSELDVHKSSTGEDHTYIDQDVTITADPTFNSINVTTTVDGRDVSEDGIKLDGIESGATADQTGAEIKVLYEAEANTNAYVDADKAKVDYITITQAVDLDDVVADIYKNTAVSGTEVNTRYDKILSSLDVIEMVYTSGDLTAVRYSGDDNASVYYRDVLEYTSGNLTTVKHYCGTSDLVTQSATTSLTYDVDDNLITTTYTE